MADDGRAGFWRALPWLVAVAAAPSVLGLPAILLLLRHVGDPDVHLVCDAILGIALLAWGGLLAGRLWRPGWLVLAAAASILVFFAAVFAFDAVGLLGGGACSAGAVIAFVSVIALALAAEPALFTALWIVALVRRHPSRTGGGPR